MTSAIIERSSRPDLLVRFVWWLLIGWWALGITVALGWLAPVSIVGIPLGIWLINHLPSVLTLRPRARTWTIGQDADGRTVISERGRGQVDWPMRGLWSLLVGWWASALGMSVACLIQPTILGLPIALLMFNRTPFVASLSRH